jgi:hypothetical protein
MKNFKSFVSGTLLVVAASLMVSTTANAQKGSRLCGVTVGTTFVGVEIKQPGNQSGRNAADNFCRQLSGDLSNKLMAEGAPAAMVIRLNPRTECEAVARTISGGARSESICDLMDRSSVGNGANPYTVKFTVQDGFVATKV